MKNNTEINICQLIQNAHAQGDKINLSTIIISLKFDSDELPEIIDRFEQEGIEVINENVEVDQDEEKDNSVVVTPFDPSLIDIKMDRITIDMIIKRIVNNELEFDSSFQRKAGLWNISQKSQLIESIILRIPLPAFYFDASNDDKWQIIDGLQRVTTIKEYIVDKKYALKGMEFLKDLNDLKYDELPRSLQRRIEETNLNAYFVNASTPKNVKFNIFKRINTGGLILTPQEIRNALYQGKASRFLLEISQYEEFKVATCNSIKSERMLDREFCLRFVLVTRVGYENYNGNYEEYLNYGMEYINSSSEEELNIIKERFRIVMLKCNKLFGRYAFRRINEERKRGPINKSLFEIWSYLLNDMSEEVYAHLVGKKELFYQEYIKLSNDYDFVNYIKSTDKNSIKNRYILTKKMIDEVLDVND